VYVIRPHYPGGQAKRTIPIRFVELEPARPIRTRRIRIYRNDLEENFIAELEKAIVRSHARMLTADLRCDPECFAHVFHSDCQGGSADGYVVYVRTEHAAASSSSKFTRRIKVQVRRSIAK
jgi:hypothetical protein